jgi:hypothetical protein
MTVLPTIALSVRQPWAWAIIHAGKPVENRSAAALRHMNFDRCRSGLAIHASKGMTREEYEDAAEFMATLGVTCPPAASLERGGIVGVVDVAGTVSQHASPWFFGPRAILLANPRPCRFAGAAGALGLFEWTRNGRDPEPLAKWMRPSEEPLRPAAEPQPDLFRATKVEPL